MKKIIFTAAVFLSLFPFVSGLHALDFSADVIMQHRGTNVQKGKIFVSGEKTRMELREMIVITRMDKKVAWMLMPTQKMYMEQPVNPDTVVSDKLPGEIERKLMGQETIDGRVTDKYMVTYKDKNGSKKIYQWICKTTGIPVKTAQVDGSYSMEFKNMKTGKQDASLFEIPSDYSKMSMQMPRM